jgi:hypothetical protein
VFIFSKTSAKPLLPGSLHTHTYTNLCPSFIHTPPLALHQSLFANGPKYTHSLGPARPPQPVCLTLRGRWVVSYKRPRKLSVVLLSIPSLLRNNARCNDAAAFREDFCVDEEGARVSRVTSDGRARNATRAAYKTHKTYLARIYCNRTSLVQTSKMHAVSMKQAIGGRTRVLSHRSNRGLTCVARASESRTDKLRQLIKGPEIIKVRTKDANRLSVERHSSLRICMRARVLCVRSRKDRCVQTHHHHTPHHIQTPQ